jgi:hypothetical protein
MKKSLIIIVLLLCASLVHSQTYRVDWRVIGSGGKHSESPNFQIDGTAGQAILGRSASSNYQVEAGFWVGVGLGCKYIPGNSNGVEIFNGIDITYSVNYLKGIGPAPPDTCDCPHHGLIMAAADANGDCGFNGIDVSYSVNFLKGFGGPPRGCSDCPARGIMPPGTLSLPIYKPIKNGKSFMR